MGINKMVQIQLELPEKEDKKLKHFMIDNNIKDKRIAIIEIVKKHLS